MAIYRFRVTFEDHDDVSRDIEIRSVQSFEDFHHSIHSAIGFDGSRQASFYMSDDHWTKGKEITNRELKETEKDRVSVFRRARLCDFIIDPHQKIYYLFDPESMWAFRIELIKILPQEEIGAVYPRCIKVTGDAPKQFNITSATMIPPPEDFDPELADDLLEDDDDDLETETSDEQEVVAVAEDVSGMGELDTNEESSESEDEFESSDDEMMEDESGDQDEF